jgi:hypothetical protein
MEEEEFNKLLKQYLKLQPFKGASNKNPFENYNALYPKIGNAKKFFEIKKKLKENISNLSKEQLIKIQSTNNVDPDIEKISKEKLMKMNQ